MGINNNYSVVTIYNVAVSGTLRLVCEILIHYWAVKIPKLKDKSNVQFHQNEKHLKVELLLRLYPHC